MGWIHNKKCVYKLKFSLWNRIMVIGRKKSSKPPVPALFPRPKGHKTLDWSLFVKYLYQHSSRLCMVNYIALHKKHKLRKQSLARLPRSNSLHSLILLILKLEYSWITMAMLYLLIVRCIAMSWWPHQMKTFFALLALCAGIHRTEGQWHGASIFYLICALTNGCVNNRDSGDLRRHLAHSDFTVMSPAGNVATS